MMIVSKKKKKRYDDAPILSFILFFIFGFYSFVEESYLMLN